jgi:hypothetical protein
MKKFLRNYANAVLTVFALVFFGIILGYFFWGVGVVIVNVQAASHVEPATQQLQNFNVSAAAGLNYKGVLPVASN